MADMAGQWEGTPASSSDEDEQRAKVLLQQAKDEQLFVAVRRKCPQAQIIEAIQECLSNGANINAVNTRGKTILDISKQKNYNDVVRFLSEQDGKGKLDLNNGSNSDSYSQKRNESRSNLIQKTQPAANVDVVDKKTGELNALLLADGKRYLTEDKIKRLNIILQSGLDTAAVMNTLIQCHIDIKYRDPITNEFAIDIAWEYRYYDAMLMLLKAGSQFPKTFTLRALYENKDIPDKLINFAQERQQLNEWIKNNKLDEIQKFFTNQSSFQLSKFFSIDNNSVLELAAEYANVETVAFLISVQFPLQERHQIIISEEQRKLLRHLDKDRNTLLSIAAKSGKLDNVELFIRCGIDMNYRNKYNKRAIDLAWNNRSYDVVLALLKADSDFPYNFNLFGLNEENNQTELKLFVAGRNKLHKLIRENCLEEIKSFTALDDSKLYLNSNGQSALFTAIKSKKFDIYAYLKSIGLAFKNEDEEEYINDITLAEKDTLKTAMIREFPQVSKGHILYLISKTRSQKPVDSLKHIDKFYQYLDHIPEVSIILQVLQYTDYLDIVLDFDNENIMHINPTASETTRGTTDFKEGRIYVAAKCEERQLSGTLAHELTHQAMYMIYKNDCNPYNKEINNQSRTFDKITADIKKRLKKIIENLHPDEDSPMATLATSFKYPEDEQQSEVIARVSHILAQYPHMGRDFLTTTFRSLNDYYNDVLNQCREFIKNSFLIKPRNSMQFLNETLGEINNLRECKIHFKEPINLDAFFQSKKQAFLVESENPFLAHLSIYESVVKRNRSHFLQDSLFIEFSTYMEKEDEILKLFYSPISKVLCLCCSADINKNILNSLKTLRLLLSYKPDKKIIIIIQEGEKGLRQAITDIFKNNYIQAIDYKFKLNNFTEDTQQMLLDRQIIFQGENNSLNKFIDIQFSNEKLIVDTTTLVKLIKGQRVEIGCRPPDSSYSEGAYSELFEELHMETFIDHLLSQDSRDVFIISGVSSMNKKTSLVNCLSDEIADISKKSKIFNLRNSIEVLNQQDGAKNLDFNFFVTDEQFDERDFKKVCHSNPARKIYWILLRNEVESSKFVLQQIYNPDFYVTGKRFNPEVVINKKVVEELCNDTLSDVFIIRVKNETEIMKWFQFEEKQIFQFEANRKKNKILFTTFQDSWEDYLQTHTQIFVNQTVHLLEFIQDQLMWYKTNGSIAILNKYRSKEYKNIKPLMDEGDVIKTIKNRKVTIIAGEPGTGKSTSLTQLYEANFRSEFSQEESLMKSHWVIKINLKDNFQVIRNIKIYDNDTDDTIITNTITEFLLRANKKIVGNSTKSFVKGLLGMQLRKDHCKKMLFIIFDGFDEILDEANRNKIKLLLQLLKEKTNAKFCITTRLHYEKDLQTALSSFSLRLEPMDQTSVRKFISQYFSNRFNLLLNPSNFHEIFANNGEGMSLYSDVFLFKMQEVFKADVAQFIGTPLQLYLLLEVSVGYFREWTQETDRAKKPDFSYLGHDIWEVYEKFINRKYEIVLNKTGPKEETQLLKDKENFDLYHMDLAKRLFNMKSTVKKSHNAYLDINLSPGIVKSDGNSLNFIHSTFVEYFAAKVLIYWMEKWKDNNISEQKQNYLCNEILQLPDYRVTRTFLNAKILKDKLENVKFKQETYKEDILYTSISENHLGIIKFVFYNFLNVNVDSVFILHNHSPILHTAAEFQNVDIIKWLLEKGADVNQRNRQNRTILHDAALKGNFKMVKLLIENGAEINAKDDANKTILHDAVRSGNLEIVKYLVERGSELKAQDEEGQSALHIAAEFDNLRVVKWLVENGANINAVDFLDTTVLHKAVAGCVHGTSNLEVVEWLVENGADVNSKTSYCQRPLHIAGTIGNMNMVKLLVRIGADINARDRGNSIVLHSVVNNAKKFDLVKWLVKNGADKNAKNSQDQSVLHRAIVAKNVEIVRWLVKKGADVNSVDKDGRNILHMAVILRSVKVLKLLFKKGAHINPADKYKCSILHHAINDRNVTLNIVKWLVKKGANVNAVDNDGQSVLHVAVKTKDINIVKLLVEKDADVNAIDKEGQSVLHVAVKIGDLNILELLVGNGANITAVDRNGRTVLYGALHDCDENLAFCKYFIEYKFEIIKWLVKKGVDVNTKSKNGSTILHCTVIDFDTVKWLIENGADVNARNKNDCTVLHDAVAKLVNLEIVKLLIENGADVKAKDERERTVLHHAIGSIENLEVIKLLVWRGADINAKDSAGCTVLHLAGHFKHLATLKWLVAKGADINAKDNNYRTVLHYAAPCFENIDVVCWLIEQGVDAKAKDKDGRNVLHYCVKHFKQLKVVEFLVKNGASINTKDENDCTLLHYAVSESGDLDVVKWLVEKGADLNAKNKDSQAVIHKAVKLGWVEVVQYLVDMGVNLYTRDGFGQTVLHIAAAATPSIFYEFLHLEIMKRLIKKGADINIRDHNGRTPLHHTIGKYWKVKTVEWLVRNNADINAEDQDGNRVLHEAAKSRNKEFVKLLVGKGAFLNVKDKNSCTVLHHAVCKFGNKETVKWLTETGVDINAEDKDGRRAVHLAATSEDIEILKFLAERNAELNAKDKDFHTVLHYATKFRNKRFKSFRYRNGPLGNLEIIKWLVEKGIDVNAKDKDNCTVLHYAVAKFGHLETVAWLIENGADIRVKDKYGQTALQVAAKYQNIEIVQLLVEKGADMRIKDKNGQTVLCLAAENKNVDITRWLVEKSANMRIKDRNGQTVLHIAAKNQNIEIVRLLVEKGANMRIKDKKGQTVLHVAAKSQNIEVVRWLVDKGANMRIKDKKGQTVLHVAAQNQNIDLIQYLVEEVTDMRIKDNNGQTVLHVAAKNQSIEILRWLFDKGADIRMKDKKGQTVLHVAAKNQNIEIFRWLVEKGCDVEIKDKHGQTALHIAAKNQNIEIVRWLMEKGADMRTKDKNGHSVLDVAIKTSNIGLVQYLAEHGAYYAEGTDLK